MSGEPERATVRDGDLERILNRGFNRDDVDKVTLVRLCREARDERDKERAFRAEYFPQYNREREELIARQNVERKMLADQLIELAQQDIGRERARAQAAEAERDGLRKALQGLYDAQIAVDAWSDDDGPTDCESAPREQLELAMHLALKALNSGDQAVVVLTREEAGMLYEATFSDDRDHWTEPYEALKARLRAALAP